MELFIDRIVVRDRARKELRNIESLAESIRQTGGPLHPPVVRRDGDDFVLVAGGRRLAAMRLLGWDRVVVTVAHSLTDELAALHAENEENTEREPLTVLEALALAEHIEATERAEAQVRMLRGTAEPCADSAQGLPRTRDAVAKAVGMSHPKLAEARQVVAAAADDGTAQFVPAKVATVDDFDRHIAVRERNLESCRTELRGLHKVRRTIAALDGAALLVPTLLAATTKRKAAA